MCDNKCESCGKDSEELVTRLGFKQTFWCEFVCTDCFFEKEGKTFEEYSASDYYGELNEQA